MARYIGSMVTSLEASVARGRASVRLEVSRSVAAGGSRRLGLTALALIVPAAAVLGFGAVRNAAGLRALDLGFALVAAIGLLCIGGCALLAVTCLRFSGGHDDGGWRGRVSIQLATWELIAALIGLVVVGVFAGHLLADWYGCVNGVRSAC